MDWTLYKVAILFALILAETAGQYYLKKGSKTSPLVDFHLVMGLIFYALVGLNYYYVLKSPGMSLPKANAIWSGGVVITVALASYFMFNERLSYREIVGITVTTAGILIMS
tara:strand:+ start:120 stop:452 length:333 start_codon:yes stop_codon:yes gene_type:complete